ncbi:MAG: TlpA disulfide reductase family protein, partial [Clostridia bacterium]|nr:TlpA disulfide reductase family protein [Clostridia bacterium]
DDVQFLMIDLTDGQRETVEKAKAFIEEEGYTFPVVYDTNYSAAQAYGVQSVPMTVFVDADGNLADIRRGAMSESELEKNITELIGG